MERIIENLNQRFNLKITLGGKHPRENERNPASSVNPDRTL